jgi:hypothetical protein
MMGGERAAKKPKQTEGGTVPIPVSAFSDFQLECLAVVRVAARPGARAKRTAGARSFIATAQSDTPSSIPSPHKRRGGHLLERP